MRKLPPIILLLIVVFYAAGCHQNELNRSDIIEFPGSEKIAVKDFRDTLVKYYTAEQAHQWDVTYAFRSRMFKKLVPYATYQAEMEKGMSGWNLVRVEILSISKQSENVETVRIRFYEKINTDVAAKYFANRMPEGTIATRVEEITWKYTEGAWVCLQPGERGHLPLNNRIVDE